MIGFVWFVCYIKYISKILMCDVILKFDIDGYVEIWWFVFMFESFSILKCDGLYIVVRV